MPATTSTPAAQPFAIGQRVAIHPASDWWMRGAKYGTVVKMLRGGTHAYVTLERAGLVIRGGPYRLPLSLLEAV